MLKLILISMIMSASAFASISGSIYNQTVNLARFENNINQGFIRLDYLKGDYDIYGGVFHDGDNLSDNTITYTDKQISPFLGLQTKVLFKTSRFYGEVRDVYRQGRFPDDRDIRDLEIRAGALGYALTDYKPFFTEWYYNIFYSHLYDDKMIFQGWHKQGIKFNKYVHVFNEFLGDSFDFTKQEQFTVDARPGIRLEYRNSTFLIQLLTQYLIPIDNSGRPKETRSTLVLYKQF